jgi:hypothetical protein
MRARCVLAFVLLTIGLSTVASGCYTEYEIRPEMCRAVWVPGHYGPWGRWHPGHWRCR